MSIGFNIIVDVVLYIAVSFSWLYLVAYILGALYCSFFSCSYEYNWGEFFARLLVFVIFLILLIIMIEYTLLNAVGSIFGSPKKEKFLNEHKKED